MPEWIVVPSESTRVRVVYADAHLLAVDKPAGVLSQPDASGRRALPDMVGEFLSRELNKPGNAYVGTLHRLDRAASGVTVFARTSKAAARMASAFREGRVEKAYTTVVSPDVETVAGKLRGDMARGDSDLEFRRLRGVKLGGGGSGVAGAPTGAVLDVRISTGRKHQIRRMLSEAGHPVVGDAKYGSLVALPLGCRRGSIMLHASRVAFAHPVSGERIVIASEPPWPRPFLLQSSR